MDINIFDYLDSPIGLENILNNNTNKNIILQRNAEGDNCLAVVIKRYPYILDIILNSEQMSYAVLSNVNNMKQNIFHIAVNHTISIYNTLLYNKYAKSDLLLQKDVYQDNVLIRAAMMKPETFIEIIKSDLFTYEMAISKYTTNDNSYLILDFMIKKSSCSSLQIKIILDLLIDKFGHNIITLVSKYTTNILVEKYKSNKLLYDYEFLLCYLLNNNTNYDSTECTICYENNINITFIPCNHIICFMCSIIIAIESNKCPYCRKTIYKRKLKKLNN